MKKKIYLIGGGGHSRACIDVIESLKEYELTGIIDLPMNLHKKILGIEIIGTDSDLGGLVNEGACFHVSVGFIDTPRARVDIFDSLQLRGANMPSIVSPRAYVSRYAEVDSGTIVMHGALVNSSAAVGKNCIINTNALIEHDAVIGDHCHVSTGSIVNGGCSVSSRVFIGSNSVLAQGISICEDVVVGAGTVIHKDIKLPGVYVGNPFRKVS